MLLQLLVNVCHVLNTELKQKERSDYISYYNIIIDKICKDKHNVIYNNIKIKKAQLINNKNIKDNNMLITLLFHQNEVQQHLIRHNFPILKC